MSTQTEPLTSLAGFGRQSLADVEVKTFRIDRLKVNEEKGMVEAAFAKLGVVDHSGVDRILSGAIGRQAVVISAYGHRSWYGELPVGKGRVFERDGWAVMRGSFFMDTQAGRETFLTVKNVGGLQEWSFALPVIEFDMVREGGRDIRNIKRIKIPEVSPVLMGEGIDTHTIAVKAIKRAIATHSTATTAAEWDGPGAVSRVSTERRALRAIHAWVDADGDPDAKSSYKFPHHAQPGASANLRACSAGIAALNGARGGADIPADDRRDVYNHLARHLRDGEREVPELRATVSAADYLEQLDGALEAIEAAVKATADHRETQDGLPDETSRRIKILSAALRDAGAALDDLASNPNELFAMLAAQINVGEATHAT